MGLRPSGEGRKPRCFQASAGGSKAESALGALLSISSGHLYSGAEETGVEETGWLHSQLARVLGTSGFAPGASGRERVRFVWFRL